jgi:hypothetical protein
LLAHKLEDTVSGVRLDAAKGLIRDNDLRGVAYLAKQADQATDPEEKLRLETALEELKVTPEIRKKALQSAAKKGPK